MTHSISTKTTCLIFCISGNFDFRRKRFNIFVTEWTTGNSTFLEPYVKLVRAVNVLFELIKNL